jgi:hypothetical protein
VRKLRHTAALVLVGWYLMVPPLTPEGLNDPNATLVNGTAPISQWVIFRAYDSADQCEQERRSGQLALVEAIKANPELLTDRAQYGLKAMELLEKVARNAFRATIPGWQSRRRLDFGP